MGASQGWRAFEEVEDGLPDGRHARLWRRSPDSFFSVPLLYLGGGHRYHGGGYYHRHYHHHVYYHSHRHSSYRYGYRHHGGGHGHHGGGSMPAL